MPNFEIFTDSSCDLSEDMIEKYNLHVMQLDVMVDDKPPVPNNQLDIKKFYDDLRKGSMAKTSAVAPKTFEDAMRKCLQEGKDIFYLGFSSGLSATFNNGRIAIEELKEEFADRKLLYTDTLAATVGQGLLVQHAAKLKATGMSIEDILNKINVIKTKIIHEVTTDDLMFLKRGGRIDAKTALIGSVLNFKPIINVDKEGKLVSTGRVRGRKASIKEMFTRLKNNAALNIINTVFISHCDCIEDAKTLKQMITDEFSNAEVFIENIGPVIGAHLGPGGMALCYLSK